MIPIYVFFFRSTVSKVYYAFPAVPLNHRQCQVRISGWKSWWHADPRRSLTHQSSRYISISLLFTRIVKHILRMGLHGTSCLWQRRTAELQRPHWQSTQQTLLKFILSYLVCLFHPILANPSFLMASYSHFLSCRTPRYYHAEFEWKVLSFWRKKTQMAHSKPTSLWQLPFCFNSVFQGSSVIFWAVKKVPASAVSVKRVTLRFLRRSVSPFCSVHFKS